MEYALFIAGVIAGAAIVLVINRSRKKDMEDSFSALSRRALSENSTEFLKLASQSLSALSQAGAGQLEEKKKLIDQTLEAIKAELSKVERSVAESEGKREKAFGEMSARLKQAAEQTGKLQDTTSKLQMVLANTRARGQWGERMAEDILRFAGLVEGVNYVKQAVLETGTSRPDYTFLLPQGLKVNMDVKFPLDNYLQYVNEESEPARQGHQERFLRDARQRIKEVATRDYINPEDNTVDYCLVFVPNEQVYGFINENDRSILDDALRSKVIFCSPLSLYAILAVMRQAVDNFALEQTADRMLSLFGAFNEQWARFKESMDKMGARIRQADEEYGRLTSTRRRALERPLRQIDDLRRQRGILTAPFADPEAEVPEEDE
ncbi:MAG: DNA recombination protein RmuC [Chloroflexi bacterium]|nr:DNA recombination protein RmuC [Chloroflexota bacterium]